MSEIDNPTFQADVFYKTFQHIFAPYLDEAGIDKAVLTDPTIQVPLINHAKLLNITSKALEDDCLGLHIGSKTEPIAFGAIGFAIMNSKDINAALENLSKYSSAYTRGCFFELNKGETTSNFDFGYNIPELGIMERRQEAELTLSLVVSIVRKISGENWRPVKILFEHPQPVNTSEHKRIFGAPVEFNNAINTIVFNNEFLKVPVKSAQSTLYAVIEEHLQKVIDSQSKSYDFVIKINNLVAREFINGVPTIDWAAEQLNMTRRTLQRRLEKKNIVFSEIVDEVRRNMAIEYVEKSTISLTEISYLLGYSHLSAFCRSFRRWTESSPQSFRSKKK